jgi:hypothetical protein
MTNASKQFKQIKVIFFAVLVGLLLFFMAAVALVKTSGVVIPVVPSQMQSLESLIIILALGGIPAGHYFHKRKVEHINPNHPPIRKLSVYRVSYFIKLATLEGLGLISLLAYMMSARNSFLLIFCIFIVTIIINYPSRQRVADELQTTEEELFSE